MWPPDNERKVFDLTGVVENILDYIEEFNEDALGWANDGTALAPFESLYPNAPGRLITMFPSLVCLSQKYETDLKGDVLIAALELKFEGCVAGHQLDDLVLNTKKYAMAVESMLTNIPSEDLTAGYLNPTHGALMEIGSSFDLTGQLQNATNYLAIFQTSALYQFTMAAFGNTPGQVYDSDI